MDAPGTARLCPPTDDVAGVAAEPVDEQGQDSFPASDPPSWWPGASQGDHRPEFAARRSVESGGRHSPEQEVRLW